MKQPSAPAGIDLDISVVVPAFRAEEHLPAVLRALEAQTLRPCEVVVVDSSPSHDTRRLVSGWSGPFPLIYKPVEFAFPGHARNLGVEWASGEWIAFIDCRTQPSPDWLERTARAAQNSGAQFVCGLCSCEARTQFQKVLRAATYGNEIWETLPGSLVSRSLFQRSGGFSPNVRAGEDLEWLAKIRKSNAKCAAVDAPSIVYHGFPLSLAQAAKKWFVYGFANAALEVRNEHKGLYLALLLVFVLFMAYNWNAVFADWQETSLFYVPNITKISVVLAALAYFVYRGLVRPLGAKVEPAFLLPWRWLAVAFVGMCLDVAKAPGLLWGAGLMLKRRFAAFTKRWLSVHRARTRP